MFGIILEKLWERWRNDRAVKKQQYLRKPLQKKWLKHDQTIAKV